MKKIILSVLSIISLTIYGQNITELEKQKSILNSRISNVTLIKKNIIRETDSILAIKVEQIGIINLTLEKIIKSKDSLNKIISSFKISIDNLKIYNTIKTERIIDTNSKKYRNFYIKIKKANSIPNEQKFLLIRDYIYLEKFDENGRVNSIKIIKHSNQLLEKQDKLMRKGSISILAKNDSLLEFLTGVNSYYLALLYRLEIINQKIDETTIDKFKLEELKINILYENEQKKSKLDDEINQISFSISGIDNEINKKIIENQKVINYSRYKSKKVNGIDICTIPLAVREFRNGDEIKKARTEGEWNKFIELKIPAYHYKDFDDNKGNFGFIFNYYAITDNRELAPFGFHKLNLIDFNYLENQYVFTDTKLVDCYCGDGKQGVYESCHNCNYWTESQRKYNICSKCKNKVYFERGTKKCSTCSGTKKVKVFSMIDREFCVFPSTTNNVEFQNNLDFISFSDGTSRSKIILDGNAI